MSHTTELRKKMVFVVNDKSLELFVLNILTIWGTLANPVITPSTVAKTGMISIYFFRI